MKKWEVQVHKRYQYQSNTMYYGTFSNWQDATEYEYIEADYCEVLGLGQLLFWNGDKTKLKTDESGRVLLDFRDVQTVAVYHQNQWLSVREYKEDGTEHAIETVQ